MPEIIGSLQVGGEQNSTQSITAGDGNDTVYQFGGRGDSIQTAEGGTAGNQTFIQVGGQGNNAMTIMIVTILDLPM